MKCPVCETTDLVMTERQGVEIDYCPKCRGVWLDRGELDKIIERSGALEQPRAAAPSQREYPQEVRKPKEDTNFYRDDDYYNDDFYKRQPHKKKNWLGEVFDIFD
ncbi:MAG: zf-TFIIB domain-containing protein [Anaerolineae bacterium]